MASAPNGASIQGVVDAGQPVAGFPVSMGFKDPTGNNQFVTGDALGNLNVSIGAVLAGTSMQVEGKQAAGAAITENPVLVAGQFGGNVKLLGLDTNGGVTQGQPNAGGTSSWPVQGAGAAGAALVGNPNLIGVSDGANAQLVKQGQLTAGAITATGVLPVQMLLTRSTADFRGVQTADQLGADAQSGSGFPGTATLVSNAASWDRLRNNIDVTLLASASRTTTQTSADITTYNLAGISVFLNMTVVGTGSVTVTINGKDPASGVYYNILTGAAVVTNVGNLYRVMPGIPAVANKDVNAYLPRVIQIVVTANNANPATYSVGYTLHVP